MSNGAATTYAGPALVGHERVHLTDQRLRTDRQRSHRGGVPRRAGAATRVPVLDAVIVGGGLPGVEPLWGRSVFHCPFCDGWEVRDRPLAVHGRGPEAARSALVVAG